MLFEVLNCKRSAIIGSKMRGAIRNSDKQDSASENCAQCLQDHLELGHER